MGKTAEEISRERAGVEPGNGHRFSHDLNPVSFRCDGGVLGDIYCVVRSDLCDKVWFGVVLSCAVLCCVV